ncbi:hypothetical protein F0521_27780 [Ferrimonas sp. YFM]|nr:hypothetical protein F0521_27780 [Ferrimonas sp. YFM]
MLTLNHVRGCGLSSFFVDTVINEPIQARVNGNSRQSAL